MTNVSPSDSLQPDPVRERAESYIDAAIAEIGGVVTPEERDRAISKVEKFARKLEEATRG